MTYEYKYVTIEISPEQQQVVDMGLAKMDEVAELIMTEVNQQAEEGWEPLHPFGFPTLWFKREVKKTVRKKTVRKKTARRTSSGK
jgi:hypothetical protein